MDKLKHAVELIKNGEVVAFPTETVYGLGANALNQQACLQIYKTKGRPAINPLIVHVADINQAKEIAKFNDYANLLAHLWPGPLTLVLPKQNCYKLASCVTAGLDTVAIRIPAHKTALALITESNCPIAAPSANKSGQLSPTSYSHVIDSLGRDIFTLDDEFACQYGLESTIVDLSTTTPIILRFGFFTPELIKNILGINPQIADKLSAIKAPGMMLGHYAPKTKLRLNAHLLNANEVGLNFGSSNLDALGSLNLSQSGNLAEAAANIFSFLHRLDHFALLHDINIIAIAPIPNEGIGLAINDRLTRAAQI